MWKEGRITIGGSNFHYWVKHYDESSQWGIGNGRISKLMLKRGDEITANFDRGWDVHPVDEDTRIALARLLKDYN